MLAAWAVSGRPRSEKRAGPAVSSTTASQPASLGALAPKASDKESAIEMPQIETGMIQERFSQRLDAHDRRFEDVLKRFDRTEGLLEELVKDKERKKEETSFDEQSNAAAIRDLREQVDLLRTQGGAAGKPGGPREIGPLEIIRVPPSKEEKPRSDAGRMGGGASRASENPFWLPAGSMVETTLITGVECHPASTAPGMPVMLLAHESALGPNGSNVPLDGCLVLGLCDADLSSERVKINATLLSCVLPGGRTLDRDVQGYVTGGDGKLGIAGKLHDKRGRKVAMTMLAGFTAGLAQALGQSEVTRVLTAEGTERTFISGNAVSFGMSKAFGDALAEVTTFYRKQVESLTPVLEIPAGIKVGLVMERGVNVPELNNLFNESAQPIQ